MVVNGPAETLLMIIENEKAIIPLSSTAFVATQSSRRVLERYLGALVIDMGGHASRIAHIQMDGPWDQSFARKVLSVLTSARAIEVHFQPSAKIGLVELKRLICEYLRFDQERDDPYLPQMEPLDVVIKKIEAASSTSEIFKIINVPDPDDALDVL